VNSNFYGFRAGIVPAGCGYMLQSRGFGFSTELGHPNVVGPNKQPYHTIIPSMLTYTDDTNDLYATITNMGGNMQPQGHVQLTVDMVAGEMDPQAAINMPRFCNTDGMKDGQVQLEVGIDESMVVDLT
jgi:gamma-glutamyltranspeptidase / glutathione hydrolase